MAPVEITDNYYALLEISIDATDADVRRSYLRLAAIRHPDKNGNSSSAKDDFQLLVNAYQTIKDPEKRRLYDSKWKDISRERRTQEGRKMTEAQAEKTRIENERNARQERLRSLLQLRSRYERDVFGVSRLARKLATELKSLEDQDDEELRQDEELKKQQELKRKKDENCCIPSLNYSEAKATEEQQTEKENQAREIERLQRQSSRTIKGNELDRQETIFKETKDALSTVNRQIVVIKNQQEKEEARIKAANILDYLRRRQEARNQAEQKRKQLQEEFKRMQQEELKRKQQEKQKCRQQEEQKRKQQEDKSRREDAMRKAKAARKASAYKAQGTPAAMANLRVLEEAMMADALRRSFRMHIIISIPNLPPLSQAPLPNPPPQPPT